MKKLILTACAIVLSLGLAMSDAEAAKRLGGGKSSGMQRESVTQKQAAPQPATPAQQTAGAPAAPQAAPAAPAAQPKRNWLGPLAGLAAGIGLAALLSHFGLGEGLANFVMIALLVMAALFVFKLIFGRKRAPEASNGEALQYAGVGGPGMAPSPVVTMPASGAAAESAAAAPAAAPTRNIPADFDTEAFLRVAKLNFIRLQAANDTRNLDDLREFLTPEFFAEVRLQFDERGPGTQDTDVVSLNGEVLEVVSEGGKHIVSVRFNGTIREENQAPETFDEVWHLVKPIDGSRGWQVAGIQQLA